MGTAQLRFTDNADGTLAIDARHDGVFDPALQSHACLRAVSQFLPQVLGAQGVRIEEGGEAGARTPCDDGERYRALRALALLDDASAAAIARLIDPGRSLRAEADYDAAVDRLAAIARGSISASPADAGAASQSLAG